MGVDRKACTLRRGAVVLTLTVFLSACGGGGDESGRSGSGGGSGETAIDLEPVPHPDLTAADPNIREQLDAERQRYETALASDLGPDQLALVYGVIGRLYHAHDFLGPAAAGYRNAVRLDPRQQPWHYYLGTLYQHLGNLDEAAAELNSALELETNAATLRRLGDIARAQQQPAQAQGFYERALAADPACHAARLGLAETVRDHGDMTAAAAHYRAVLERQPDAHLVHYPLAQVLLRLGERDAAEVHLQASDQRPAAGGLARCSDPLDDERQLLITGAPIHIARGRQAAIEGDQTLELSEYRKAVELAPDLPLALQSLGHVLARRGETAEAYELYARATRFDPQNPDLRHDLGSLSLSLGRSEEAQTHFRAALELRPDHVGTRLQLGRLVQIEGRAADAIELYDGILETAPTHPQARLQRAACLAQLGRRQEAIADLGTLLDIAPPEDPTIRLQLASALAVLGDRDRALDHLLAVLDLDLDSATRANAHVAVSTLLEMSGDTARAAEHRRAAQAQAPPLQ